MTTARPSYAADALGIGVATGVYGISFGVLAVTAGLSEAQALAMSLLVFTGGSQFAAVSVLAAGGAAATAAANALLLAVRNCAYGLSLASLLRGPLARRAVAAQLVIDETTAMQEGAVAAAIAGAVIALVLMPWTRPGVPVIAASLGVVAGVWRRS